MNFVSQGLKAIDAGWYVPEITGMRCQINLTGYSRTFTSVTDFALVAMISVVDEDATLSIAIESAFPAVSRN